MIFNKLYNLTNQTAQPGTLQNIKSRFHHNKVGEKATQNIGNLYPIERVDQVNRPKHEMNHPNWL